MKVVKSAISTNIANVSSFSTYIYIRTDLMEKNSFGASLSFSKYKSSDIYILNKIY